MLYITSHGVNSIVDWRILGTVPTRTIAIASVSYPACLIVHAVGISFFIPIRRFNTAIPRNESI